MTSGNVSYGKGASVTTNVTNTGVSPDLLTQLVGSLTQAQPVDQSSPAPVSALAPPSPVVDTSGTDTTQSPLQKYWVVGGIVAVLVVLFVLKKIKL